MSILLSGFGDFSLFCVFNSTFFVTLEAFYTEFFFLISAKVDFDLIEIELRGPLATFTIEFLLILDFSNLAANVSVLTLLATLPDLIEIPLFALIDRPLAIFLGTDVPLFSIEFALLILDFSNLSANLSVLTLLARLPDLIGSRFPALTDRPLATFLGTDGPGASLFNIRWALSALCFLSFSTLSACASSYFCKRIANF